MIITRHEIDEILQGFSFYSETPVILLIHDGKYYYSITKYFGNCDVGVPTLNAQAIAFQNEIELNSYIELNSLLKFETIDNVWHDETTSMRIKLTHQQNTLLLQNAPELAVYIKQNNIISVANDYFVYVYVNYLLDEHRQLIESINGVVQEK